MASGVNIRSCWARENTAKFSIYKLSMSGVRARKVCDNLRRSDEPSGKESMPMRAERQVVDRLPVPVVARHQFVAALTRQRDLDVARGEFRNEIERHAGRVPQ